MKNLHSKMAAVLLMVLSACSTAGTFVLPPETTLKINGREAQPVARHPGMLSTRPFSWRAASGVPYQLLDAKGNVVREGTLATHFRTGSLLTATLVGAEGLRRDVTYDLTCPADGHAVMDAPKPSH